MIIHADHGALGSGFVGELYERFPDFGFFEDEYFDDGAVWAEELVEVVVRNDVTKLVVDAH